MSPAKRLVQTTFRLGEKNKKKSKEMSSPRSSDSDELSNTSADWGDVVRGKYGVNYYQRIVKTRGGADRKERCPETVDSHLLLGNDTVNCSLCNFLGIISHSSKVTGLM